MWYFRQGDARRRQAWRTPEDQAVRRLEQPARGPAAAAARLGRAVDRGHPRTRLGRASCSRARSRSGRDPACELPLHDDNVSWRHARIEDRGNGEWAVVDLGSTNGTLIDGQPCAGAILRPGNRVFLGTTVLEVQQDPLRDAQAQELERLITIDELSGLWVKRRFDVQLESSVAAVLAGTVPALSVVVMDMDGVKAINDTHGHAMGAFTIGAAGHVIGKQFEGRGFATRFGGDEFAGALPGMDEASSVAFAEQVRLAVVAHVYDKDGVRVHPGLELWSGHAHLQWPCVRRCGRAVQGRRRRHVPGEASGQESRLHVGCVLR